MPSDSEYLADRDKATEEARPTGSLSRRSLLAVGGVSLAAIGLGAQIFPSAARATGSWSFPTNPYIPGTGPTQQFGAGRPVGGPYTGSHAGFDIQGAAGAHIYAIGSGTVVGGSWTPATGWGNHVIIQHSNGIRALYAHFSSAPVVANGSTVSQGQQIGVMGGSANGNLNAYERHLHIEIRENGVLIDPRQWLSVNAGGAPPQSSGAHIDQVYYDAAAAVWRTGWTGYSAVGPSQVSAVYFSGTWPMAMYQQNSQLWQEYGTPSGWINGSTGVPFSPGATISAVNMGGYQPQVMAIDNGMIYQIWADSNGWHKDWTGLSASGQIAATSMPGNGWPVSMVVDGGLLYKVWVDGGAWRKDYTGVGMSGSMSAAYNDGSSPTVISQEGGVMYHTFVGSNGSWAKLSMGIGANGYVSAVQNGGIAPDVIVSSSGYLYHVRHNGTSWQVVGGLGLPTTGVFSAVNVGGAYPQVINYTASP